MTLIKRTTKGTALTYSELDGNFTHLGGDGTYQFPSTDGTNGKVLTTNGSGTLSFQTAGSIGPMMYSVESVTGGGALSTSTTVSFISSAGVESYSLADGVEGQQKIIIMKAHGGNATVTPTNLVGYTSVRFTGVNNNVHLLYGSTGWNIIALQNATRIA